MPAATKKMSNVSIKQLLTDDWFIQSEREIESGREKIEKRESDIKKKKVREKKLGVENVKTKKEKISKKEIERRKNE